MSAPDQADELWRTGQIAVYLSRYGLTRKAVSDMVNSGELGGAPGAYRRGPGKWARVPKSAVLAYEAGLRRPPATPA